MTGIREVKRTSLRGCLSPACRSLLPTTWGTWPIGFNLFASLQVVRSPMATAPGSNRPTGSVATGSGRYHRPRRLGGEPVDRGVPRDGGPTRPRRATRTSVRNRGGRLYSPSRGRAHRRSPRAVRALGPGLVRGDVRGPHEGAGRWLGGDQPRAAHADPRPHRQRQDPRRVPVVPRPARPRAEPDAHQGRTRHRPHPLCVPAEGTHVRRGAQPPRPARRHRAGGPAAPATRPPTSGATSSATRRTSSSRRPRACISCSRARRARSCAVSSR